MKSLGTGVVTWSYQQYRTNAEKEYDSFWRAFFREAIQNAADACSTKIDIVLDSSASAITVTDDGIGMDLDVIRNRLLVIGGSKKDAGATGGLGKAKELLFFSQPIWQLTTNNYRILGEGGEYEIFEMSDPIKGTSIEFTQPSGVNWIIMEELAKQVITRCYLKATLTLNGEIINPAHPLGEIVNAIDGVGDIYHFNPKGDNEVENQRMHVMVNGCWMFSRWIGNHKGFVTLNIDPTKLPPHIGLTANRDQLKMEYQDKLSEFVRKITVDTSSALEKKKPIRTTIKGSGSIYINMDSNYLDRLLHQIDPGDAIRKFLGSLANMPMGSERIENLLAKTAEMGSYETREEVMRFAVIAGYDPDFVIFEDPENDLWDAKRIERFMPSVKSQTVAKVWTETLRQVMIDNGMSVRFKAGFIFNNNDAMREQAGSDAVYYVNPARVPATGIQNKVQFMNWMRTTAIHEITHHFVQYHDESFMIKYHELETRTWDSHRLYAKIGLLR